MYQKGKHFLGAALLLRQKGGHEYVVLHLLCMGIEITLKALLLFADYDTHKPKLRRPYGHDLMQLTCAMRSTFGIKLRPQLEAELKALASLYKKHLLRYGTPHDFLVGPTAVASDRVFRRMEAVVRLAEREAAREWRSDRQEGE